LPNSLEYIMENIKNLFYNKSKKIITIRYASRV